MKDFRSYSTDNRKAADGGAVGGDNANKTQNYNTANPENLMNMVMKAFAGKGEGQIWQTIVAEAERGKREGTLTNADLDNFCAYVLPMLDGVKRAKLKQIIAKLKEIEPK